MVSDWPVSKDRGLLCDRLGAARWVQIASIFQPVLRRQKNRAAIDRKFAMIRCTNCVGLGENGIFDPSTASLLWDRAVSAVTARSIFFYAATPVCCMRRILMSEAAIVHRQPAELRATKKGRRLTWIVVFSRRGQSCAVFLHTYLPASASPHPPVAFAGGPLTF